MGKARPWMQNNTIARVWARPAQECKKYYRARLGGAAAPPKKLKPYSRLG